MTWIDAVGYAGSLCVALAMTMRSILRLRYAALAGSMFFILYGALLEAYPILFLNLFTTSANLYYIVQMRRSRDYFELLEVRHPESRFLQRFLEYHKHDIAGFFPDFDAERLREPVVVFILRNLLPAGLVICEPVSEDTLEVRLDYVIPEYRDMKSARYFYREWDPELVGSGYTTLLVHSSVPAHVEYLRKVGFRPDPVRGPDRYVRSVRTRG
jgi:hypothetical protein